MMKKSLLAILCLSVLSITPACFWNRNRGCCDRPTRCCDDGYRRDDGYYRRNGRMHNRRRYDDGSMKHTNNGYKKRMVSEEEEME